MNRDRGRRGSGSERLEAGEILKTCRSFEREAQEKINAARGRTILPLEGRSANPGWSPPRGFDGRTLCDRVINGILQERRHSRTPGEPLPSAVSRYLDHELLREIVRPAVWDPAFAELELRTRRRIDDACTLALLQPAHGDEPERRADLDSCPRREAVVAQTLWTLLFVRPDLAPRRRSRESFVDALVRIGGGALVREFVSCLRPGGTVRSADAGDWRWISGKLLAYAAGVLAHRSLLLGESRGALRPEARDLVHDALLASFLGERSWDPEKVPFVNFLCGAIRSRAWNDAKKIKARLARLREVGLRPVSPEAAPTGDALLGSLLDPSSAWYVESFLPKPQSPEDECLEEEVRELESEALDAILRLLSDDPQLRDVTRMHLEGLAPGEIADRMGVDRTVVYNALRRLHRRASTLLQTQRDLVR